METRTPYRGRFAPSPSGALHFGSLIAALASYLEAKKQNGEWLLRIDDVDFPRVKKGSSENIIKTLAEFGFEWNGEVLFQSHNQADYEDAVQQLLQKNYAYPCSCSRAQIIKQIPPSEKKLIYPGFCRNGLSNKFAKVEEQSIRLRCEHVSIEFNDRIQGKQNIMLEELHGDFVLKRRDGNFSYQLASAIDDADQGITEVLRGVDLLDSTPCQLYIQEILGLTSAKYCHIPIMLNSAGDKLSKQAAAAAIKPKNSVNLLFQALKFLGQKPSIYLLNSSQNEIWEWAQQHWQLNRIPKHHQICPALIEDI